MNKSTYFIQIVDAAGEIVKGFTWSYDKMSGIQRAKVEARNKGINNFKVEAVAI